MNLNISNIILIICINLVEVGKMITVSLVGEYLYCPFKVYLNNKYNSDVIDKNIIIGQISHESMQEYEKILKKNLWDLKGDMKINDILEKLFHGIPEHFEEVNSKFQDRLYYEDYIDKFQRLKEDMVFNSWIMALKIQKLLKNGVYGSEAVDILFPTCLTEFLIEDEELGLSGKVDRIEIIDGVYYPITTKTNLPPLKGVWEADALQITGYAILMEREFNKKIKVGFVNYNRICCRKPVLISSSLIEKFNNIFNELTDVVYGDYKPEIVQNVSKCRSCECYELCDYTAA